MKNFPGEEGGCEVDFLRGGVIRLPADRATPRPAGTSPARERSPSSRPWRTACGWSRWSWKGGSSSSPGRGREPYGTRERRTEWI